MKGLWPIVAVLAVGFGNLALSQDQVVDRAVQGQADKDIRVGVYLNVKPDCRSGPLPAIRLSSAPAHGKVTVKKTKINITNFKECLALEVPGYVAFYKSQADFSGSDVFVLEVKFPGGKTEIQRVTVTVASPGSGRGI